jgi:asparagine synthase (glutamine-hydrolysing)
MCGILGWYHRAASATMPQKAVFEAALTSLRQRGPDAEGLHYAPPIVLGHRRLAIIDCDLKSNQPMWDASGRYALVFNGMIYNFLSLKSDLCTQGYHFRTQSDTEVLLYHLIAHGVNGLAALDGFFAFGFWDNEAQSLLLARDRSGIKPLWLFADDQKIAFASTLQALLHLPLPRRLNPIAFPIGLQLNYLPPSVSPLMDFHSLSAGHYIMYNTSRSIPRDKDGMNKIASFSYIPDEINEWPEHYYQDEEWVKATFHQYLSQAVQKRLQADVPVGILLSGGLDSSIVTAIATEQQPGLHSFSITYPDFPAFDESSYALLVAQQFGTTHHAIPLTVPQLASCLSDVIDNLDTPLCDAAAINFYVLAQATSEHVRVALSGDGADELLGGYRKHMGEWQSRQKNILNSLLGMGGPAILTLVGPLQHWGSLRFKRKAELLARYIHGFRRSPRERYLYWSSVCTPEWVTEYCRHHAHDALLALPELASYATDDSFEAVLLADQRLVLGGDMLPKIDLMGMAHALEVRSPFMDRDVVAFGRALPTEWKNDGRLGKIILRQTYAHTLPPQLFQRPKQGFEVPLGQVFRQSGLLPTIGDELLASGTHASAIFNPIAIQAILKAVAENDSSFRRADWTLWAIWVWTRWLNRVVG